MDADGLTDGDPDALGLLLALGDTDALPEAEGDFDADGEVDRLSEELGDSDLEAEALSDGEVETPARFSSSATLSSRTVTRCSRR